MGSKCVLIVEDDDAIRECLAEVIRIEGVSVETCKNGKEALENLHQQGGKPSLILLDWMMPEMNGEEFVAAKNQDPTIAAIPVTVISAVVEHSQGHPGISFRIRKPIELESLLSIVRFFCRKAS
jgi:CheY-like chemotaxis protein